MVTTNKPIVVAFDGSEHAYEAASWATAEASRRHAALHLLIVNDDPVRNDYAEKAVHEVATRCRDQAPELVVTDEVAIGHPVDELVHRSANAQMIVVGSRGHGRFVYALLGSVSTGVATHGSCPVVVVRRDAHAATGPVVVGLDNSWGSRAALGFAFEAAAERDTELVAIHVWHEEGLLPVPLPAPDKDQVERHIERSLTEQLAGWAKQYPGVRTRAVAQRGHPVAALTDAARGAQLLVTGHRGHGGFRGLFMGSVASGVLHHAACPVAVVRDDQDHGQR